MVCCVLSLYSGHMGACGLFVNMCTSSACWYDAFMALAETNGYSTEIRV